MHLVCLFDFLFSCAAMKVRVLLVVSTPARREAGHVHGLVLRLGNTYLFSSVLFLYICHVCLLPRVVLQWAGLFALSGVLYAPRLSAAPNAANDKWSKFDSLALPLRGWVYAPPAHEGNEKN